MVDSGAVDNQEMWCGVVVVEVVDDNTNLMIVLLKERQQN